MKYEITEEQIKDMYAKLENKSQPCLVISELTNTLKSWYPEVFETKLELNKWYKWKGFNKTIGFVDIKTDADCYGFKWTIEGIVKEYTYDSLHITNLELATEKEVLEALTNEAIKRGFVKGAYIKSLGCFDGLSSGLDVFGYKGFYHYDFELNTMYINRDYASNIIIFEKGVWAEIIKTYTKEEAEKMLNAKIV